VADYSIPAIRPRRARRRFAATIAGAGLLLATLLVPAGAALAAGGNLDHFTVAIGGTPTAGVNLALTLTAKDGSDRTVRNYDGAKCLTFSGPPDSPNGTPPSYPAQGACAAGLKSVAFANGIASPAVKAFRAGSNSLTATDPAIPFSGSSATFTVKAGPASTLTLTAAPIDTKVGTPIYSACVPDPTNVKPCASTTQTPASSAVAVSQVDAWGNISSDKVTIGSVQVSPDASGIASFGDALTISQVGPATVRASTSATTFVDATPIQIVYDLKACDAGSCKNSVDNGQKNVQRAVNTITTGGDFYTGTTNVILTTSFFDTTPFQGECGVSTFIGMGTEAKLEGTGVGSTAPTTTMLLLIPKKSLLAFGVSARSAASFQVCLGADRLDGGTDPWIAKNAAGVLVPAVLDGTTYWGNAADCSAFTAGSSNPCAALNTKNVGDVQAYFTSIGDTATAASIPSLMGNSDLAVIVRQSYPWDQKGMMN